MSVPSIKVLKEPPGLRCHLLILFAHLIKTSHILHRLHRLPSALARHPRPPHRPHPIGTRRVATLPLRSPRGCTSPQQLPLPVAKHRSSVSFLHSLQAGSRPAPLHRRVLALLEFVGRVRVDFDHILRRQTPLLIMSCCSSSTSFSEPSLIFLLVRGGGSGFKETLSYCSCCRGRRRLVMAVMH